MADPKRLSELKKKHQKLHDQLQEKIEARAYELHVPIAEIDLALEDFDSVGKVFPEEFDPDGSMRRFYAQIEEVKRRIKQE
jgi:hypothetical protein